MDVKPESITTTSYKEVHPDSSPRPVRISSSSGGDSNDSINGSQDERDMAKLGKKQQLRRNFEFWSIVGFSCTLMSTWEGILTTFIIGLTNGGPTGVVVGFIFVWVGYGFTVISLAELISMWPTSSGQYHWTYTLAPPKWAPLLSYICGWQSVIAWQASTASAVYYAATTIQALALLNYPDYEIKRWQGTLIMYGVVMLSFVSGTVGLRFFPTLDRIALFLHVAGFVVIVVVVSVMSPAKATTAEVFSTWFNAGWSSQGVSFFVGLQGLVFSWIGADGAIHLAEEIKDAATVLPWSLLASVLINGSFGLAVLLVVLFYGGNLQTAIESPVGMAGMPYQEIFTFATGSVGGGTGLTSIVTVMITLCALMVLTAASRELWAFARDKGLPGSGWLSIVNPRSKMPLNAMCTSLVISLLLALVNIGSSIAFGAIVSLVIAGFLGSYMLPIAFLLYRRIQAARGQGREPPWGPWSFGKWGIPINLIAVVWCITVFIFSFWPYEPNPTPASMNWVSLAYGAITIFALIFWFVHGRNTYRGPVRDAAEDEIEPAQSWSTQALL